MKALKITFDHGRIWTVETSDGKHAQSATLRGAAEQLLPVRALDMHPWDVLTLEALFDGIQDSTGASNIARGQASA